MNVNMNMKGRRNARGFAMIATLVLFGFLTVMIAAVLRGNATRRNYLRMRRHQMVALCMAESGVQEALHALATRSPEIFSLERGVGSGRFEARWARVEGADDVYEIVSIGTAYAGESASAVKRVRVRVKLQDRGDGLPAAARTLSWCLE